MLPLKIRASTAIAPEHEIPLKIEQVSSAVKRLSGKAGLDAPVNKTLHALLSPCKSGRQKSGDC
jgi:ketopantoate reductase